MLKKINELAFFALLLSFANLVLYYFPFYKFVCSHLDIKSLNGIIFLVSLTIAAILLNALVFYIVLFSLRYVGKWILVVVFNINAIALYFINTYSVIIDKTMIGNVFNTNYEEASSFFSFKLILYFILIGILPSILILKIKVNYAGFKRFIVHVFSSLLFLVVLVYLNSSNSLWIDKNSKTLGGLVMPWNYIVNTNLYFHHKKLRNKEAILLPDATLKDNKKAIAVLVIGESARSENFSLYGYKKETNPLLSKISNVNSFRALSNATSTTVGVKSILDYKDTDKLYEILPNYLFRNNIEVIWRTSNWGEPTVKIKNFQNEKDLKPFCTGEGCEYDEILLTGLKEQILESKKDKILVVLHTSTSHGPTYYKKYPPRFSIFNPVCMSVELANCTQEELINAYDNSIVYTDYILAKLIEELKQLNEYSSAMIYISDHGESLGENNLYMHGIPVSIAPKEQLEIPFIVWLSDDSRKLKENKLLTQHHIFHSVLDFLGIESPIFDGGMSVFEE